VITPGLVSVTFRQLEPSDVVRIAAGAGLAAIEWGGDVHVPDGASARRVGAQTAAAGLRVACFGSYLRLGHGGDPAAVVSVAAALGAPLIRVWAGRLPSASADAAHRSAVVAAAREIAGIAADAGLDVAFEYHRNTLTDTRGSALRLLADVDRPNVGTLWQPEPTRSVTENLGDLESVLPWLRNVHVFSWAPDRSRLPLDPAPWTRYLGALDGGDRCALLEFVAGDDPARLALDARTLISAISETGRRAASAGRDH
jgi:3-dehydroshikimate dehydratase